MPTLPMVAQRCPSDDRLLAFAEGLLDDAERETVEAHVAGCADCSAILGATYEASPREPTTVGRYEVLEELGQGGMGRVVRARDPSLGRDVAIKQLLPSMWSSRTRERFAREAATLGALHHPNVIEVFDVGISEQRPFFVMELVEGQTLGVWSRGRDTAEVLACLQGAGRGLAAAHAKGVLHRDFKPANVMVGADGRARVGDFGLAGDGVAPTSPGDAEPVDELTKTGALIGTLPYMAPELLDGGKASVRSDQFAFCVTMHEVLYGRRPFAGADARALSAAIRDGEVPPEPPGIVLPRHVRRALVRGLSVDPAERFRSMRGLLGALRTRRVPTWAVVGMVGAVSVGGGVALFRAPSPGCAQARHGLDGIYDGAARTRIRDAFASSGLPYAKASSRSTVARLDAYAAQWVEGTTEVCRAAERGELSDQALDQSTRCFRHAALGLKSLVELLEAAAPGHVERGGALVAGLSDLALCSDPEGLQRFGVLPADADEAAQAEALEPVLSQVQAHIAVDDFDGAWDLLERNDAALQAATYPPIRVRTLRQRARVSLARQDFDAARAASLEAHALAQQHRLDREASETARFLGWIASRTGEPADAQRWFDRALAHAAAGGSTRLQAFTLMAMSRFHKDQGDLDLSVETARRSVELIEHDETLPPTSRAELLLAYADRLHARESGDDGLPQLQEAQRILLETHGDTHPAVADVARNLLIRASQRGDHEVSYQHALEALRIHTEVHGEDSRQVVSAWGNLAVTLKELGRFDEAADYLRKAEAVLDANPDYSPAIKIPVLSNLGFIRLKQGRNAEARTALQSARALLETRGAQRERFVLIDGQLAQVELRDGNLDTARRLAQGALDVSLEIFGENHFYTADVCTRLGEVELEAGNFDTARALLRRALAVEHTNEADRGEVTYLLARALVDDPNASDSHRAQGLDLARKARVALTDKPAYGAVREALEAWLARQAR